MLHDAAANGEVEEIKELIHRGEDVNGRRWDRRGMGYTALHMAAMYGEARVISVLISAGAHIHPVDRYGRTPLNTASFFGKADAAKRLIRLGADIHARDYKGLTPLHASVLPSEYFDGKDQDEILETARVLIRAGADLHVPSYSGATPLDLIESQGHAPLFIMEGLIPRYGDYGDEVYNLLEEMEAFSEDDLTMDFEDEFTDEEEDEEEEQDEEEGEEETFSGEDENEEEILSGEDENGEEIVCGEEENNDYGEAVIAEENIFMENESEEFNNERKSDNEKSEDQSAAEEISTIFQGENRLEAESNGVLEFEDEVEIKTTEESAAVSHDHNYCSLPAPRLQFMKSEMISVPGTSGRQQMMSVTRHQ